MEVFIIISMNALERPRRFYFSAHFLQPVFSVFPVFLSLFHVFNVNATKNDDPFRSVFSYGVLFSSGPFSVDISSWCWRFSFCTTTTRSWRLSEPILHSFSDLVHPHCSLYIPWPVELRSTLFSPTGRSSALFSLEQSVGILI